MLDAAFVSRCYAHVPVLFWPVLAWNLYCYRCWVRDQRGTTISHVSIEVTWFGWLRIVRTVRTDEPLNWRVGVFGPNTDQQPKSATYWRAVGEIADESAPIPAISVRPHHGTCRTLCVECVQGSVGSATLPLPDI